MQYDMKYIAKSRRLLLEKNYQEYKDYTDLDFLATLIDNGEITEYDEVDWDAFSFALYYTKDYELPFGFDDGEYHLLLGNNLETFCSKIRNVKTRETLLSYLLHNADKVIHKSHECYNLNDFERECGRLLYELNAPEEHSISDVPESIVWIVKALNRNKNGDWRRIIYKEVQWQTINEKDIATKENIRAFLNHIEDGTIRLALIDHLLENGDFFYCGASSYKEFFDELRWQKERLLYPEGLPPEQVSLMKSEISEQERKMDNLSEQNDRLKKLLDANDEERNRKIIAEEKNQLPIHKEPIHVIVDNIPELKDKVINSVYPKEKDYVGTVEWLKKKKKEGTDFYAGSNHNRTKMCEKLTSLFGWEVNENSLGNAERRSNK